MTKRFCLREPIPEIEIAARWLDNAVSAHLQGDRAAAAELLRLADDKVIWDWVDSIWGKKSAYNQPRRRIVDVPEIPSHQRSLPRQATLKTKRQIHQRDGYYCRYCQIPVIRSEIRILMNKLYPAAVPWGNTNNTQHAGFQCMWAQYDHVLPHARGGSSELDNVYLTCAACNYGRDSFLLEEFDLVHPSERPPRQGGWNGLERVLAKPANSH